MATQVTTYVDNGLDASNKRVINVSTPISDTDSATKNYADGLYTSATSYADNLVSNLNANNLVTGTIPTVRLPQVLKDLTNQALSNSSGVVTLNNGTLVLSTTYISSATNNINNLTDNLSLTKNGSNNLLKISTNTNGSSFYPALNFQTNYGIDSFSANPVSSVGGSLGDIVSYATTNTSGTPNYIQAARMRVNIVSAFGGSSGNYTGQASMTFALRNNNTYVDRFTLTENGSLYIQDASNYSLGTATNAAYGNLFVGTIGAKGVVGIGYTPTTNIVLGLGFYVDATYAYGTVIATNAGSSTTSLTGCYSMVGSSTTTTSPLYITHFYATTGTTANTNCYAVYGFNASNLPHTSSIWNIAFKTDINNATSKANFAIYAGGSALSYFGGRIIEPCNFTNITFTSATTYTMTSADILSGSLIYVSGSTSTGTIAPPSGANLDSYLVGTNLPTGCSFLISIINTTSYNCVLGNASGFSFYGNMNISAGSSSTFRIYKAGASSFYALRI